MYLPPCAPHTVSYRICFGPAHFRSYSLREVEHHDPRFSSQKASGAITCGFDVVAAKRRQAVSSSVTVRFVMISQIRFGLHCLPVPISDVFNLSQSSRERECPSTAGETDSKTYTEVLPGIDRVRRFCTWERDEDDERGEGVERPFLEPMSQICVDDRRSARSPTHQSCASTDSATAFIAWRRTRRAGKSEDLHT